MTEQNSTDKQTTLVVGVGSAHGDDQVGWKVVKQMQSFTALQSATLKFAKSPVDLLDWVADFESLIVCDACRGLGTAGTIQEFTWPCASIDHISTSGSHNLNLPAALTLASRLGKLPRHVKICVIEVCDTKPGLKLSAPVARAIPELAEKIHQQIMHAHFSTLESCTNNPL